MIHDRCHLRPDNKDWMTPSCNAQYWPGTPTLDDHTMHVPPTVKLDTRAHLPQNSDIQETFNPGRIRRRASQGSLRTRPSPVSRFLSKSSVAVNFPSWDQRSSPSSPGSPYRLDSRTRSVDSRLRLSTTVSRGPRPLAPSPSWNAHYQEYPAILPPTPPEEDIHVAWNPKSEMMLFDAHSHHPRSMAMMDDNQSVDNSSATGASDTFSSPSDGRSSSSGGSPGPHDDMDCQQDIGSWLDHGINLTGKFFFTYSYCRAGH